MKVCRIYFSNACRQTIFSSQARSARVQNGDKTGLAVFATMRSKTDTGVWNALELLKTQ